jgi:hypothetical protein
MSEDHLLAAIRFQGVGHWQSLIQQNLRVPRWGIAVEKGQVYLIPNTVSGTLYSGIQFLNSFQLSSFWCGPQGKAISLTPVRKWLDKDGNIDRRPEYLILSGGTAPPLNLKEEVQHIHGILDALSNLEGFSNEPIALRTISGNLLSCAEIQVKSRILPCSSNFNAQYKKFGFHFVPTDLSIHVAPLGGASTSRATEFSESISSNFNARGTNVSVSVGPVGGFKFCAGRAIVLLLPGDRETPLHPSTIAAMRYLDENEIRWRRAYENDPFQFSVPDQIGSILQCAGGVQYCVGTSDSKPTPWSLGLDLSHPREGPSRVCGALLNPTGNLVHSWVAEHARDETISQSVLKKIIIKAVALIPDSDQQTGLLILRDGRLFEKEHYSIYREGFGLPVTLLEVRKRRNPPILTEDACGIPQSPVFCSIPQRHDSRSHVAMMICLPTAQQNRFGQVLKLHWRDQWNGLSLKRTDFAAILTALVHAPGLGNKARALPAPIYWADGIAAASDQDLRFRGQIVSHI